MADWSAEVEIDEALVRHLLTQFPDLAVTTVVHLSEGWDRSLWVVNDSLAFGFPRRERTITGFEREIEWLPQLAPLLPFAIPNPTHVGVPDEHFRWPFYGTRFVPGKDMGEALLSPSARHHLSLDLARFLHALHEPALARTISATGLPVDLNRRADMTKRVPLGREQLAQLEGRGLWSAPPTVAEILAEAEGLPLPVEETVVHGDLHFRQIISDGAGLTGVVDWNDLSRSDASLDLQVYWSIAAPESRPDFRATYGPISDEQLLRARAIALWLSATLANYAAEERLDSVLREALASLDRCCLD